MKPEQEHNYDLSLAVIDGEIVLTLGPVNNKTMDEILAEGEGHEHSLPAAALKAFTEADGVPTTSLLYGTVIVDQFGNTWGMDKPEAHTRNIAKFRFIKAKTIA